MRKIRRLIKFSLYGLATYMFAKAYETHQRPAYPLANTTPPQIDRVEVVVAQSQNHATRTRRVF